LTNEGLLLLSHLTKIVPQQVTLHMVPILAFMGASVFQRDDAASQRVIEAIMGGIVPVLAKSHRDAAQTPGDLVDALAPVVKTFTDVIVHVPAHRRTSCVTCLSVVTMR
jgi:U3 small nucleolar RNA-associated protein 10